MIDLYISGQVAEWFKATVLKTVVGGSSPWVRIPPCPPNISLKQRYKTNSCYLLSTPESRLHGFCPWHESWHSKMAQDATPKTPPNSWLNWPTYSDSHLPKRTPKNPCLPHSFTHKKLEQDVNMGYQLPQQITLYFEGSTHE